MPETTPANQRYFPAVCCAVLAAVLFLATGCPSDSGSGQPVQYQNMQQPRQGQNTTTPPPPPPPAEAVPEEGTEVAYTGPRVDVIEFEVDLPYPEYDSPGRYDIKCKVKAEEAIGSSSTVWEILAYSEDGEQVGSKQLHIVMYDNDYKALDLNSFYCSTRPASLEFRLTDKTPSKPGEGGSGTGSPKPPTGGTGGGGGGGAGSQNPAIPGVK